MYVYLLEDKGEILAPLSQQRDGELSSNSQMWIPLVKGHLQVKLSWSSIQYTTRLWHPHPP